MKFLKKKVKPEDLIVADEGISGDGQAAQSALRFFSKFQKLGARNKAADGADGPSPAKREGKVKGKVAGDTKPKGVKHLPEDTEVSRDSSGVIAFGRKKVAAGLQWLSVEEGVSLKARLAELSEASHNDASQLTANYKFYTSHRNTGFIGVGSPEAGHSAGMKTLITMIDAEIAGPRWIGAFKIDKSSDLWWIGAVRDGKVFADSIWASRSSAEAALNDDLQAPGWTTIFTPDDWGIEGSNPASLVSLIDLRKGEKFKSATVVKDNLPRAIILAMLVGAVGAGGYYFHLRAAEEQRQLDELRAKAAAETTYTVADLPWFEMTASEEFIRLCAENVQRALITVPGWENQPISCSIQKGKGSITTGWARSGGRSSWLRAAVPANLAPPVFAANFESATWAIEFDAPKDPNAGSREPMNPEYIEPQLVERFQNHGLTMSIRAAAGNQPRATNRVLFNSHEMKISASYIPLPEAQLLADIPALKIDGLVYTPSTGNWDMALNIYHPPLTPPPVK